jgi:hypothetical protein
VMVGKKAGRAAPRQPTRRCVQGGGCELHNTVNGEGAMQARGW